MKLLTLLFIILSHYATGMHHHTMNITKNHHKTAYFAIPKTASTTARSIIKSSSCFHDRIGAVQHRNCNGSDQKRFGDDHINTIATIREPCSHFKSMHKHILKQEIRQDHIYFNLKTLKDTIKFVSDLRSKCEEYMNVNSLRDINLIEIDNCLVNEMISTENEYRITHPIIGKYKKTHVQIPLWPQAYYLTPKTHVVCYDPVHFEERIINMFNQVLECDVKYIGADINSSNVDSNVLGEIRKNDHMTDRNHSKHKHQGIGTNRQLLEEKEDEEICDQVRMIYPRDALIWDSACKDLYEQ